MDCCGSYPDYRHSAGGGGGVLPPYHPYNQQSAMRYPQAASIFHNVSVRPPNHYDSYDRFSGYQTPPYNPNYSGNIFGYNQSNTRDNSFYAHHRPYDSFRMAPAYPYHHHQHNREHYNSDVIYGGPRNGYVIRDTSLPSSYPYSTVRSVGDYPYHHHNGVASREFYQTSHHNLPNSIDSTGTHHTTESYGEYPAVPVNFTNGSNGFTSNSNATDALFKEVTSARTNRVVLELTGFTLFRNYSTSPLMLNHDSQSSSFTLPIGIVMNMSYDTYSYDGTCSMDKAFSVISAKDVKPRKHQRDKNLSKLAAMSRRLETTSNMINEIDRIGTTPFIPNLYQNHPPEHQHSPNNYNQPNSRFHDESPPSNTIPNWHALDQSNPAYSWINGPYGSRSHHRKRHMTPEPQVSPMLPSIRPPSQPNTTRDYQKIASGVLESDFIPSKKRRKHKNDTEDSLSSRDELQNITPLPAFQQAFGSTEIGRFSEVFFNASESPIELNFESEADTLSPQPWETGDSLEGPHINLQIGATVQPMYAESYASTDSPASSSYFSEIRCNDF